ncbi:MAG: flagellar biosynthetic protein FliO [Treponema sp.]|nr:flagellar biosynthetic protein FliO [Treponema sp.]
MAAVLGVATMIFSSQAIGAQNSSSTGVVSDAEAFSPESDSTPGFDENDIDFSSWGESLSTSAADARPSSPSVGLGSYVRMLLVLAFVVAAIILIFRFIKKSSSFSIVQDGEDSFLRHVAGVQLGAGKSVQIVTLVDKAYLLGVSDSSVNLIGEVEDKELVNAMNLWSDKRNKTSKPKSFADVLDMFMPRGPRTEASSSESKDDGGLASESAMELVESLRKKSSMLEGGEGL